MSWQQLQSILSYATIWSQASHTITQDLHIVCAVYTLYICAHIWSPSDKWETFTKPLLVLAVWLSDTEALFPTFQASFTRKRECECLAQADICIVILIIWFSSGCYCVLFYKSGYKMQTFVPVVPWARFSLLRILTDPLEPYACFIYLFSFLEGVCSVSAMGVMW